MGVELRRSFIPHDLVKKVADQRLKAFKDLSGKNPTQEQHDKMQNEVIGLAKRINQDRGVK